MKEKPTAPPAAVGSAESLGIDHGKTTQLPWGGELSQYVLWDGIYPAHWPAWAKVPRYSYLNHEFYPTGSLKPLEENKERFLELFFIESTEEEIVRAYQTLIPTDYGKPEVKSRPAKDAAAESATTYRWKNADGQIFILQVLKRHDYGNWVRVGLNVPADRQ